MVGKRGRTPERVASDQVASGADSEFAQYGCPRACGYNIYTHTNNLQVPCLFRFPELPSKMNLPSTGGVRIECQKQLGRARYGDLCT
jgi:hypothetical protein